MARPRILKQVEAAPQRYVLAPAASRHDLQRAADVVARARAEADAIVARAQERAAAIVGEAEARRDAERAAVERAALAQARREVESELRAEMEAVFGQFRALVERARVTEEELRRASRIETVTLATAIAEAILRREVALDPAVVARIAEAALAFTGRAQETQIYVHPDDLPTLERWAGEALGEHREQVALLADPRVSRGGCFIGTKSGFTDARLETQLAELRAALTALVEGEEGA